MEALKIRGNGLLSGIIDISGSKNATLPILAATILAPGKSRLRRVPDLTDVRTLQRVLAHIGIDIQQKGKEITLDATNITGQEAPCDLVRTMRASILILGPLLARFGRARVSLPGGCAIGARPIDQHLKGLSKLGAEIKLENGYVEATADKLVGAEIIFDMPTVGGTEQLMIAASLAEGTTVLRNAAREPEIVDLAVVLKKMGADIKGAGTERISIVGQKSLKPFVHDVVADRIEFGTFLIAGALVGDNLTLRGGVVGHQTALLEKIKQSGAKVSINEKMQEITVSRPDKLRPVMIKTAPYPGFPTDMQAQMMALLSQAEGTSVITETIFENRFMHAAQLGRLGAKIRVDGGQAFVTGGHRLSGATVMATDLRAGACLILAALVADGETIIRRIYHLDRGYEQIENKLRSVGACIERFKEKCTKANATEKGNKFSITKVKKRKRNDNSHEGSVATRTRSAASSSEQVHAHHRLP